MKFCLIHNYINMYFLNFGKKQSCVCKIYKHIYNYNLLNKTDTYIISPYSTVYKNVHYLQMVYP